MWSAGRRHRCDSGVSGSRRGKRKHRFREAMHGAPHCNRPKTTALPSLNYARCLCTAYEWTPNRMDVARQSEFPPSRNDVQHPQWRHARGLTRNSVHWRTLHTRPFREALLLGEKAPLLPVSFHHHSREKRTRPLPRLLSHRMLRIPRSCVAGYLAPAQLPRLG